MTRVVLVTGVSRYLGSRLAGRLAADPRIDRVIGVDTAPPARADLDLLGRTEFVRADIRNPLIAKVIEPGRRWTPSCTPRSPRHRTGPAAGHR